MSTITNLSPSTSNLQGPEKILGQKANYHNAAGDKVFIIPVETFIEKTGTNKFQRNTKSRVKKMAPKFNLWASNYTEVSAVYTEKELVGIANDSQITISSSTLDKSDAHTRCEYWSQEIDADRRINVPEMVTLTVREVKTFDEYRKEYDSKDSQDSVDGSSDKIYGAFRAIGYEPSSNKLKSGGIGTALRSAYPGDSKSALDKVSYFKDELVTLDKLGAFKMNDKDLNFQVMWGVLLIALKYYSTPNEIRQRLITGIKYLIDYDRKETLNGGPDWHGFDAIAMEFTVGADMVSQGAHRRSGFKEVKEQMDMMLYFIEKYMNKETIKRNKGYKPANANGKMNEFLEALETIQPAP
jgi:hypothetical protein